MATPSSDVVLERLMSLHPKIIDLTLDRMTQLLDALGSPETDIPPAIHIAGTNGKGSTGAMIRAGLEASGDKVHAYTSPHLARFHERIRLAGDLIDETLLSETLEECERINGGVPITYFEITTCAAFLAFSRVAADYTILEVGLGGRLDATNVIDEPALTFITPVSVDHQQYLGETLAEIAGEKAGILKRNCFCVVGPQEDAALDVIERQAARVGATLKIHGQHWHVWEENGRLIFQDEYGLLDLPMPILLGAHQVQNAGMVVAGLRLLGKSEEDCAAALTKTEWPARMQRLKSGPLIDAAPETELWLDGGHNEAAGAAISKLIAELPQRPTHMVVGMLNTKDVSGYLNHFLDGTTSLQAVSIPGEAATLTAKETSTAAAKLGFDASEADDVLSAVKNIVAKDKAARILICGSLYLAGNILRENA
ncbi:bifunctional folylpolyglutamate synthase/dihydrofolate synthase [Amylibacter sp. SFDW26]|uniref:bifunctional folylpolyglutamate synthase/dihydrofolate synthase n=1 Tax=Amylibacter sp. SFDW26 TaxID=2652722 RepID=UPI001261B41D|nr:folylpolyglutamate synthase/dihydrofolate synthase family protein [Amylibacter sp. SFDW26]KAB7614615.1 bifunctional folylpolyglutamate synthase/dihydrofolate synthase [Amylibacter sp. SFDW26]